MDAPTASLVSTTPAAANFIPSATYLANVKASAINLTSSYLRAPSAKDLTHLPFRIASQIDHALFRSLPRFMRHATGLPTIAATNGNVATTAAGTAAANAAGQVAADTSATWAAFFAEAFQASTFKSYWGMIQYLTSRWAFTCFAMALILNRINVYGASRQRIYLAWNKRLALRIIPIMLFVPQIYHLLCGIRCQTSPNYSLYRHGDNDKYSALDWSSDGGALYTMSSTILYGRTDEQACAAVGMSRPSPDVRAPYGSFSLLWPSFLRLSVSHLMESLSCSLQQYPLMTEVGMSVFEHSLAFAEAETMITSTIDLWAKKLEARNGTKIASKSMTSVDTVVASGTIVALSDAVSSLTSPHFLDRVNVPVEVLLVALLSCGNALTSNIISVLGKQRQWRLINTGIWGMVFMGSFVWGFTTTSMMARTDDGDRRPVSSLLHFPTVAIVGFIPHMLILFGIWVCCIIYLVALVLTAVSLGTNPSIPQPSSLKERFVIAHENLQAAIQLRGINIRWYEDFYTALLRVGFAALTAASEAVFLNEGRSVEMRQFTWLEEERLDELELSRGRHGEGQDSNFQILEEYGVPSSSPGSTDKGGVWESGFAKERKYDKKEGELEAKDSFAYPTPRSGGIGAVQRTTRFYLLFIYIRGIFFLLGGWIAFGLGASLDRVGITARPRWLRKYVGRSTKRMAHERENMDANRNVVDFWLLKDGKLAIPNERDFDIEPEMRKRILIDHDGGETESVVDTKMYDWWKAGGWFGTKDSSGDYAPPPSQVDEDMTSVISMSTASSIADDQAWEDEEEGQRTPTQLSPRQSWSFSAIETRRISRDSTPEPIDTTLDAATLARLLNPKDRETREEARILAAHLAPSSPSSPGIMTRSRYRRELESERSRVLLAGRSSDKRHMPTISLYNPPTGNSPRPLAADEEAEVLEKLILSRRRGIGTQSHRDHDVSSIPSDPAAAPTTPSPTNDTSTAMQGPPCVVCQTSSRTIIAWPCRCLCVCEDCRVQLAMNNFGNCVTCRRGVQGFVRLYVP
jgi:Zinc finger, C3HC4 type (RING finger)